MHKRCVLYTSPEASNIACQSPLSVITNWDLCIICQTETKEKLQCPSKSKRIAVMALILALAASLEPYGTADGTNI